MKKRTPPTLNVFGLENIDPSFLKNVPQFTDAVFNETLIAIKYAHKKRAKVAPLYNINNSGELVNIEKEHWKTSLESAIKYFESKEEYTKCIECRDLIKTL